MKRSRDPLAWLIVLAGLAFAVYVNLPERAGSAPPPPDPLRQQLMTDPFFKGLPPDRQDLVEDLARVHRAAADLVDMDLRPEEMDFLRRQGILRAPTWPGYRTYAAQGHIFVLVPEPAAVSDNQ